LQRQRAVGAAFHEARALNAALFETHSKRADLEARHEARKTDHKAAERQSWTCDHGVRGCRICHPPSARAHAHRERHDDEA
jgi:hypothetical protein